MGLLDISTIIFSYIITDIVSTLVLVLLWKQTRKRFAGTGILVIDFAFQSIGLLLIGLRGQVPDWISMDLSNTLSVTGILLGLIGLEIFLKKRSKHLFNYLLIVIFVFVHTWFTYVSPDLAARNLNLSIISLILLAQCAWLLLFRVKGPLRRLTLFTGLIFAAYSLINVIRIFEFFLAPHSTNDYLQSGSFAGIVLIAYQMLFIL